MMTSKNRTSKIAAIAGLTMTCGMVLTQLSPLATSNVLAAEKAVLDSKNILESNPTTKSSDEDGGFTFPSDDHDDGSDNHQVTTPPIDNGNGGRPGAQVHIDPAPSNDGKTIEELSNQLVFTVYNFKDLETLSKMKNRKTIKKIEITRDFQLPTDASGLFKNFISLTEIDGLNHLNTYNVRNLDQMFMGCASLENVDLSNFNTSLVTSMNDMFKDSGITTVNVSNLDVHNVQTMEGMFANTNLTRLDLSAWKPSSYTDMRNIIKDSSRLESVKVNTNIDVNHFGFARNMNWLYYDKLNDVQVKDTSIIESSSPNKLYEGTTEFFKLVPSKDEPANNIKDKIQLSTNISTPAWTITIQGLVNTIVDAGVQDIPGYISNKSSVKAIVLKNGIYIIDPKNAGHVEFTSENTDMSTSKPDPQKPNPHVPTPGKPTPPTSTKPTSPANPKPAPSTNTKPSKPGTTNPIETKPNLTTDEPDDLQIIFNVLTRNISTHGGKGSMKLYNVVDGKELKMSNRSISAGTDWYSDKELTFKGEKYFRVSTNEWVSAKDVYEYTNKKQIVKTKADSRKAVVNSQGKMSTRGLSKNTPWASDRVVFINGKTYFRVSTNEFVSTDDVTI